MQTALPEHSVLMVCGSAWSAAVNRNEVTLQTSNGGYGQTITIDDQPALDNRASGRVDLGRYVTAYGYWQNGVFYATQMN